MAAARREFERGLDQLFQRKTASLRRMVGPARRGTPKTLTKQRVQRQIEKLVELARTDLLRRVGKREFRDCVVERRSWHAKQGKPRGIDAKRAVFREWFYERIDSQRCIYVFWTGRTCEYVGRTGAGGSRPERHFEKFWFRPVTRVDCYSIRTRREVPKAECLAIDQWAPRRNKIRSARPRGYTRCPVCSKERVIRRELRSLFKLR